MNTFLSDKNREVRRSVRAFCEREILPIAKDIDQEASFPWEVVDKMGKLGYFGIQAPRKLGGAGLDLLSNVIVIEEISRTSAGLGLCVAVHNGVVLYPILKFASEAQKEKWVPQLVRGEKIGALCITEPNVGSDVTRIEATAVLEGENYVANANKIFVTNGGVADICLFLIKTGTKEESDGISVVVGERGTAGFVVGDLEDLCGVRTNPVASIRLNDCRIPAENLIGKKGSGLKIALASLDIGRIGIAAQALGIAQAAFEAAVLYSKQRRQFGVPIATHQAVQMMIADMATQVDAARLMVYRSAMLFDMGESFSRASAMAKLHASETACKVTDMAVQIHGGYGYSKAYPVERFYRDARVTRLYEGTSEIQRIVIARDVLEEN